MEYLSASCSVALCTSLSTLEVSSGSWLAQELPPMPHTSPFQTAEGLKERPVVNLSRPGVGLGLDSVRVTGQDLEVFALEPVLLDFVAEAEYVTAAAVEHLHCWLLHWWMAFLAA